ncbi:MAG: hypothetical protein ACOYBJ_01655 [Patescibacteria group bacterium]
MRSCIQWLVIALFLLSIAGAQPASAAPTPSEQEVRQFVVKAMAAARNGTLGQYAKVFESERLSVDEASDRLRARFTDWVASQPQLSHVGVAYVKHTGGFWAVQCVETQGARRRVVSLQLVWVSTERRLWLRVCDIRPWYPSSEDIEFAPYERNWVFNWQTALVGGRPTSVGKSKVVSSAPPSVVRSTQVSRPSLAPPMQELDDFAELLGAMLGENLTPSPRVMTKIAWDDPAVQRVVRGIQGKILGHQGDYLDDTRQQFLLSVLTDSGNGHLLVTDLHFQRSSGHWTKAESFVSQGTMLCPIAHFVGFHMREGAYLGPMDPKLVKELLTVVLGADGTYAARVQPRGLKAANGSLVCPVDAKEFYPLAAALRRAASQLSVGAQAISADRAVLSLNTGAQLVVCDLVRTKAGWVLRDWSTFSLDQYAQRYAGRMATLPVEALGSIATLTKRQQLTLVAATPLGQLLIRFFRMLGVNNRREVSNYLADDIVNRVYDASWWSTELRPLAELDPADITLELSGNGALTVEAGAYRLTGTFKGNELTLRPVTPGKVATLEHYPCTLAELPEGPVKQQLTAIFDAGRRGDREAFFRAFPSRNSVGYWQGAVDGLRESTPNRVTIEKIGDTYVVDHPSKSRKDWSGFVYELKGVRIVIIEFR